jgi:hypothetical protein
MLARGLPGEQPIQNLGATSHGGAAAYLGNQLMRGFIQGRAENQMNQAAQFAKNQAGQQLLYDSAAKDYYRLAQSGTDPNSPEMQDAQQRVQASWDGLMGLYGQHVKQPSGKNAQGAQQQPQPFPMRLMNALHGGDPNQIMPVVYEGLQKSGPPVFHQAQPYMTPQYRAQAGQQQGTQQAAGEAGAIGTQGQIGTQRLIEEQRQLELVQNPNPQQQQRLNDVTNYLRGLPGEGKQFLPKFQLFRDSQGNISSLDVTRDPIPQGLTPVSAATYNRKPLQGWVQVGKQVGSVFYDPFTNQPEMGTLDYTRLPPPSVARLFGSMTNTTGTMVDANGNLQKYGKTSSTHPNVPLNTAPLPARFSGAPPATGPAPVGLPQQGGAAGPAGPTAGGGGISSVPQPAVAALATLTGFGNPPPPQANGSSNGSNLTPVGYVGSQAYKGLIKQHDAAVKNYNDGTALQSYVMGGPGQQGGGLLQQAMNGDHTAQYLLLLSYLKGTVVQQGSNIRLNNSELNKAQASAPWLSRIEARFGQDGYVTPDGVSLTPQQMQTMAAGIRNKTVTQQQEAQRIAQEMDAQKQADMEAGGLHTRPVTHAAPAPAPAASGGQNQITVVDPRGKSHYFATQAQADHFKQLAGIH